LLGAPRCRRDRSVPLPSGGGRRRHEGALRSTGPGDQDAGPRRGDDGVRRHRTLARRAWWRVPGRVPDRQGRTARVERRRRRTALGRQREARRGNLLTVHLGFSTMNTPEDVPVVDLAPALEDRGYESLWLGEHPHIPCSRETRYPTGGELPPEYLRMMDPFVSLTMAAAVTEHLRLGTAVTLALEHEVFDLAKTVATLDVLSRGRVLLGVGVGWNAEELANVRPYPWAQRYRALSDCVGALQALWRDERS